MQAGNHGQGGRITPEQAEAQRQQAEYDSL
jgi:hypothetical protein